MRPAVLTAPVQPGSARAEAAVSGSHYVRSCYRVVVPSRRDVLLDAAIGVLADGGARSLTHRAVDEAADLPAGSASNVFRTRVALIAGVLARLAELEEAGLEAAAGESADEVAADADGLSRLAGAVIQRAVTVDREATLARRALFQEAATNPDVAAQLLTATKRWWALVAGLLRRADVPEPGVRARWLLAYVDGVIADQLARPMPGFDAAAAIGPAVRGVLLPSIVSRCAKQCGQ